MQVVPVIDLMQGVVVRAVRGERARYRPIVSGLCAGSDPAIVAGALVRHTASPVLYAADLDALLGGAPQVEVVRAVLEAVPGVTLWLDAGFTDTASVARVAQALGPQAARVRPVYASESLRDLSVLDDARGAGTAGMGPALLSLDQRGGQSLDPAGCRSHPDRWPRDVIVMTLDRVGADAGPDLDTLRAVQAQAPAARLVGAGGVREAADLQAAASAGAAAWLVASALHDGRFGPSSCAAA